MIVTQAGWGRRQLIETKKQTFAKYTIINRNYYLRRL
jgi:hypothetical protein